jgi:tetratricopeptide (TPR) repeat protein
VGPVEKAFPHYEEAIRLKPDEALYLHNFGTLLFLYRKEAARFYKSEEAAIFNRGIELYRKAIALDPKDFSLASDVAQTYYGVPRPTGKSPEEARAEEASLITTALQSWTNAYQLAPGDTEREGIRIHFARWNIRASRFDDARLHLAAVTNATYLPVKKGLEKELAARQSEATSPR